MAGRAGRVPRRLTVGGLCALLVLLWATSVPTLADWTGAVITNSDNSLATATSTLSFKHLYSGTTCEGAAGQTAISCPGTVTPTSVPTSGTTSLADQITNTGTATGVTNSLSIPTCGPVQLRNQRGSDANPMLPRYAHTYQATGPRPGMGAVALNGSTSYGNSPKLRTWRAPSATVVNGIGLWFRRTNTSAGGMVALDSSGSGYNQNTEPVTVTMNQGMLRITFPGGWAYSPAFPQDTNWHFVYVRFEPNTVRVYLDTATNVTNNWADPAAYKTVTGYWRYGLSSEWATGISGQRYFGGDLSNIVVFDGNAPAMPTAAQLASQTAYEAWATGAAEHWPMDDTGTATFPGTADWLNSPGTPCSQAQLAWTATNPAGTVAAKTLAAWATPASIPAPGPGLTQTSTLVVSRITGFDPDAAGLWLLPTIRIAHTQGAWSQVFTWSNTPATARILIA